MRQTLQRVGRFLWAHRISLSLFGILLLLFFLNTFHEEYPDEFDSIVGGKYIVEGKVPYRDWFQHHQPGAYALAALILPIAGTSFVRFRVGLAVAFFLINVGGYVILKKRTAGVDLRFYVMYLFLLAFAATYFWGQMLLADTLAAYFFVPAYALILIKTLFNKPIERDDVFVVSGFGFLTWLTSMTYSFVVVGVTGYALYRYLRDGTTPRLKQGNVKEIERFIGIVIAPYVIFFLFFILTGSLKEWYFANVTYNSNYYIYNYPRPYGAPVNPLRYAVVLASDFLNNYQPALAGVAGLPLGNPLQVTLALSGAAVGAYLMLTRRLEFFIPWAIVLIYSNARSNPQSIRETDYQVFLYVLTHTMSGLALIAGIRHDLDKKVGGASYQILAGTLLGTLSLFWVFTAFFLGLKWEQKFYEKYMGRAPLIYDRPEVAPLINKLLTKDDYAWIGPFEFKELFYLRPKVFSKHHWFLNHAVNSEKIRSEIVADMGKNKPKVVVFKRNYSPWGGDAKTFNYFFTDILDRDYIRIFEYNKTAIDYDYKWKERESRNFEFDGDVYFRRDVLSEMLDKLEKLGVIEKVAKAK